MGVRRGGGWDGMGWERKDGRSDGKQPLLISTQRASQHSTDNLIIQW